MAYGLKPQEEKKQACMLMDANTNGTVSLTFKGKPALLGDGSAYFELIIRGICIKSNDGSIERIGGINLADSAATAVLKNGVVRLDFEDGRALLLKPAGEAGGVAIVKPFGILLGKSAHNFVAGKLLFGNKCLDVVYRGQDTNKKILEDIACGKMKIRDFDAKKEGDGYKATLVTERGDKIVLHISAPKKENDFWVIERIGVISAIF